MEIVSQSVKSMSRTSTNNLQKDSSTLFFLFLPSNKYEGPLELKSRSLNFLQYFNNMLIAGVAALGLSKHKSANIINLYLSKH